MNLYEIKEQYLDLLLRIESGEISEDAISDTLESVEGDFTDKADNIASYIKSLLSEALALKTEADKLNERKKQKENKAEKLRLYLESMMLQAGVKKVETARNVLQVKLSPPSVKVIPGFIPWAMIHRPELLRNKPGEPDKEKIKECINNSEDIGYCTLEQSEKLHLK